MNYSLVGWINVVILGILVTPYFLKYLNKHFFKTKSKRFFRVLKLFRTFHKLLGLLLIVTGIIHGYMALGSLRLHTGTVLYVFIFVTGAFGGSFYKTKKKVFFIWHRRLALFTLALFLLHLLAPSAIYYLLK